MKSPGFYRFCLLILLLTGGYSLADSNQNKETPLSKIAIGSCIHQDHPQVIWDTVNNYQPELFVFLGDTIYGDTEDMAVLKAKYDKLNDNPGFQKLKAYCPTIGVWDDHDYGRDNGDGSYKMKKESQQVFLDFYNVAKNSPLRKQDGVYSSYLYGPKGQRVHFILLDVRYHRSSPQEKDSVMLSEGQWKWLEKELNKEAEIRIVGGGTSFITPYARETWQKYPKEWKRLVELLYRTKANGTFLISGDVHYSQISKITIKGDYPLYDFTSSAMSRGRMPRGKNREPRVAGMVAGGNNYGNIEIDWDKKIVTLRAVDVDGNAKFEMDIKLGDLKFKLMTSRDHTNR